MTDVALDPCGTTVDYLRSCYSTQMRFDPASPASLRPVDWYFAEPGTPLLFFPTPFRSRNYANMTSDDGSLGEVFGVPRVWRRGDPPSPYPVAGPCNPAPDFLNGISLGGVHPIAPSGVKSCCYPTHDCCSMSMPFGPSVALEIHFPSVPCLDGLIFDLPWVLGGYLLVGQPSACGPPFGPGGCVLQLLFKCYADGDCLNSLVEIDLASTDLHPSGLKWNSALPVACDCGPPATFDFVMPAPTRLGVGVGKCDDAAGLAGMEVFITGS